MVGQRMTHQGLVVLVLLFLLLGSRSSLAQDESAAPPSVAGTILSDSAQPIRNAVVHLEQDGWQVAHARTGASGKFKLEGIVPNKASVLKVTCANFTSARTNLLLRPGEQRGLALTLADDTSVTGLI